MSALHGHDESMKDLDVALDLLRTVYVAHEFCTNENIGEPCPSCGKEEHCGDKGYCQGCKLRQKIGHLLVKREKISEGDLLDDEDQG